MPDTSNLIATKRPVFLSREDFDASEVRTQFDFVISHSILSHAAEWQLPLFLGSTKRVLARSGVALVSLRFFDDNNHLVGDSNDQQWV